MFKNPDTVIEEWHGGQLIVRPPMDSKTNCNIPLPLAPQQEK